MTNPTVTDYLDASYVAYNEASSGGIETFGYTGSTSKSTLLNDLSVSLSQIGLNWTPLDVQYIPSDGFYGAAFLTASGNIIVAFEGTAPVLSTFSKNEISQDLAISKYEIPPSLKDADVFVASILLNDTGVGFNDTQVFLTGHSLGGVEAEYASSQLQLSGAAFGDTGIPNYVNFGQQPDFTNYIDYGDPVGNFASNMPYAFGDPGFVHSSGIDHVGTLVSLGVISTATVEPAFSINLRIPTLFQYSFNTFYHSLSHYEADLGILLIGTSLSPSNEVSSGYILVYLDSLLGTPGSTDLAAASAINADEVQSANFTISGSMSDTVFTIIQNQALSNDGGIISGDIGTYVVTLALSSETPIIETFSDSITGTTDKLLPDLTEAGDHQSFAFTGSQSTAFIESAESFSGIITNFISGDTIDLVNFAATGATLSASNSLILQASGGGSFELHLDPNQILGNTAFGVIPDNSGGTKIINGGDAGQVNISAVGTFETSPYGIEFVDGTMYQPSSLSGDIFSVNISLGGAKIIPVSNETGEEVYYSSISGDISFGQFNFPFNANGAPVAGLPAFADNIFSDPNDGIEILANPLDGGVQAENLSYQASIVFKIKGLLSPIGSNGFYTLGNAASIEAQVETGAQGDTNNSIYEDGPVTSFNLFDPGLIQFPPNLNGSSVSNSSAQASSVIYGTTLPDIDGRLSADGGAALQAVLGRLLLTDQMLSVATVSGAVNSLPVVAGDLNVLVVSGASARANVNVPNGFQVAYLADSAGEVLTDDNENVLLVGSGNHDTLVGVANDTLLGGTGGNILTATTGAETLIGGTGTNTFYLGMSTALVSSQGNDVITGSSGAETVNASGSVLYFGTSGVTTFNASGAGGDTIIGGTNGNTVTGGGGNQLIFGSTSLDYIGGAGAATIIGGGNGNTVTGGSGNLLLFASSSMTYTGTGGAATVIGGGGPLSADLGSGGGAAYGSPSGADTLATESSAASILVGGGDGDVLTASGSGADILVAGGGSETINGSAATGNLVIFGGPGSDALSGGTGNDLFVAEPGNETLTGGGGTNSYVFIDFGNTTRADIITDFNPNTDAIGLFGYGDEPGADAAALESATAVGGNTVVTLTDGTSIAFQGMPALKSYNFF